MFTKEIFVCPACLELLEHTESTRRLNCTKCQAKYPIIFDDVPVLVPASNKFLASQVIQYERYLREQKNFIHQLKDNGQVNSLRDKQTIDSIIKAVTLNNKSALELKEQIELHLSTADILDSVLDQPIVQNKYLFDLNYLRRDWSGQGESEMEIGLIRSNIVPLIQRPGDMTKPVLFLGAGLARVAADVASIVDSVYAIDSSVSMAYLFSKVKREDVNFAEITFKNGNRSESIVDFQTASVSKTTGHKANQVKYVLSEANHLPFRNESFSAVVSVYFTDVIPFDQGIKEIGRVLAKDGRFIHYGPLEYHFDKRALMFSYEEIKKIMTKRNFEMEFENSVEHAHCVSRNTLSKKVYTNWIFSAIKRDRDRIIHDKSVLKIEGEIHYLTRGILGNCSDTEQVEIKTVSGEIFEGAQTVLDFLLLVNSERTFSEILIALETSYGEIGLEDKEHFKRIIDTLINKGILSVSNQSQ